MNKKTIKRSLTSILLFSIGGMLSSCQMAENFLAERQDTGYDYVTAKRRANVAPTVIYRDGDTYRHSSRSAGTRSNYNERATMNSDTTSEVGVNSGSMESSIPTITSKPSRSKAAGVPTEAPAVPSMAPTFAP